MDALAVPETDLSADQVLDPYPKSGRRVKVAVSWQSKAIARDIGPHLTSMTYVDELSGEADTLALEVQDRDNLWAGDWKPEFGDTVVARINPEGFAWFGYSAKVTTLRLGTFAHDKISLIGPPHRVSLQCVSAPTATGLRRRKRTKTWKKVTLKTIAKDIADRAGLTLDFSGDEGLKYGQIVQNNKSDLEFLKEMLKDVGRTLKLTESTIAIYDELALDAGAATGEIDIIGKRVKSWNFDADDSGRYGSCHITFFDPRSGKTIKGEFPKKGVTIPGLDPNGQTLELSMALSDSAHAAKRAEALLRNSNRFATSGTITTVGDAALVAGVVFDLKNAGAALDGKFIVTRAEHKPLGGYTCTLKVRRCLEGY